MERGRLNLHPLLWGSSAEALGSKAQTAFLWRAERQRESGSCVNPRCVLSLLRFCLSNTSRLCCLRTLFTAAAIAALCLVQATVLGLCLLGGFQDPVACNGECFPNLLFPCHVETDTERNGDTIRERPLHLPPQVPDCLCLA